MLTVPESPFIRGTFIQFAWNSSDLGKLKTCPRLYQLSVIEGWTPKDHSHHITFGSHYAKAMERFFLWKESFSLSYDDAIILVVWAALQDTFGWETHDTKKNRETLIRSIVCYFEAYRNDVAKTVLLENGSPAVELSFRFEIDKEIYGQPYLLCGHLDRLVDFGGSFFVMDQKTTGSTLSPYYFDQYNPHNQMTLYTLASKIVYQMPVQGVIIDAAQIAVGFTAFSRGITMRSSGQLEEFLSDFKLWVDVAEMYANLGHWPMNETACRNYGGCQFVGICNKDKTVRQQFLQTDFKVEFRNPLAV